MRKVLMIAHDFPPIGGSGVQRTMKFAKYLPEFGWQPIILTVSNPSLYEADDSLLKELPDDLPVYRALDVSIRSLLGKKTGELPSPAGQDLAKIGADAPKPLRFRRKIRKSLVSFADTWLRIPDSAIFWLPAALWVGLKIVRQCDAIYSTSAPFTDHLIASFLHKLSGKPWIADFRDPWTQNAIYQSSSRLRSRIDGFLEKEFLKNPDLVTVTCAATARGFQEAYPFLSEDKFIEITNGFDAEDFDQPISSPFDKFTITYTGQFYSKKNSSSPFLQALRELCCEHPELASEIQVIFAGIFGEQNRVRLKQWGLEEMVKPLGYIQHREGIKLLLQSHTLLLTLNDEAGTNLLYPGKLFEYLAARKTILALLPEGATADLIRDMGAGLIVPPNDVGAIRRAILELYHQYNRDKSLSKPYENLQQFERRTLSERLARCFDAVLQNQGDTSGKSLEFIDNLHPTQD